MSENQCIEMSLKATIDDPYKMLKLTEAYWRIYASVN